MRSGPRSLWTESDSDHYILQLSPSLYFGVAFLFFGVSLWRVRKTKASANKSLAGTHKTRHSGLSSKQSAKRD
jgi:hypothetical protein